MQIYYFSRSGNCKRIATEIQRPLNGTLIEIKDDVAWGKFSSFFSIPAYRNEKKELHVHVDEKPSDKEPIIVVTPIWGGLIAPTTAKFLANIPKDRVPLVTSSITDYPRDVRGYFSITSIIKRKGNEQDVLQNFYRLFM